MPPFPGTFPDGFPRELIDAFSKATGRAVLGNETASGTAIIEELGPEHMRTGALIFGPSVRAGVDLGTRTSFADLGATLAEGFGVPAPPHGRSFLGDVLP